MHYDGLNISKQRDKILKSFDVIIDRLDITPSGTGPLDGLKFAVKDMFDLKDRTAGSGTPDWKRTHAPARTKCTGCTSIASMCAGAHLTFNACADELACSLDGTNVHYGTPVNPQEHWTRYLVDRLSGSQASLVASGEVDFALGTDTAGSVRVPASYCGIFGFRPSHAAISDEGVLPLGPSFDTVGVLSRSAKVLDLVADTLLEKNGETGSKEPSRPMIFLTPRLLPRIRFRSSRCTIYDGVCRVVAFAI